MEQATMARPRPRNSGGRRKGDVGDPKNRPEPSPSFSMKGDPEWVAWVEELAKFLDTTKANLVDEALAYFARHRGFPKAAPPRFKK